MEDILEEILNTEIMDETDTEADLQHLASAKRKSLIVE